ncbi:MAG: translation initiation factor IF-2 subunit beta [archaeon]
MVSAKDGKGSFYSYEEMLARAKSLLPKTTGTEVLFQIPKADVVIEGSKTLIRNYLELCDILQRKPEHFLKFLNRELATPGMIEGTRLVLKGKLGYSLITQRVEEYVKEFVFCPACGRHETTLIKEDRLTMMKCNACGAVNSVRAIA